MDKKSIKDELTEKITERLVSDLVEKPSEPSATGKNAEAAIRKLNSRGIAYRNQLISSIDGSRTSNKGFEDYEYNMAEIIQMEDNESYAAIAFSRHIETCLKNGFHISSSVDTHTKYVKQRLFEIFLSTGMSTFEFINKVIRDLVKFSNCYIVLKRDPERTANGKMYNFNGKRLKPISGMFMVDPPSMRVKRNKHGTPVKYMQLRQQSGSITVGDSRNGKEFVPEDVVHLYLNKKEGHPYGTPGAIPVIEDVRSLRRIEEMVEMLISSHIFPLYHYIIGTDKIPGTATEVDLTKQRIENMPTEGSLVTTDRHEIKVIGAEGKALDVLPYLQHFERRVLSGLGISEITIGRGNTSNKSTAASLDKVLLDRCEFINMSAADQITHKLLIHFILDGKLKLSYDTMPELEFHPIDKEEVRAQENHIINQYQSHAITEPELRQAFNRTPLTDEEFTKIYMNRIEIPKIKAEAQIAKEFAIPTASSTGSSSAKKPKSSAAKNTTKAKVRPTNQNGTKATKTRTTANTLESSTIDDYLGHIKDAMNLHININTDKQFSKTVFMDSICQIVSKLSISVAESHEGLDYEQANSIILENVRDILGEQIKSTETAIGVEPADVVFEMVDSLGISLKDFIIDINEKVEIEYAE